MSLLDILLTPTKAGESEGQSITIWQQLSQYIILTILGLLGGTTGVVLAIGLAIAVQGLLFPTMIFLPGAVLLGVMAVLSGWGVSWLLGQAARRICPDLPCNLHEKGMQMMLIFSAFTGLLQTSLFMLIS
jgi:hypothetical protein